MRTMCSKEISTKKCRQQQIFDSNLKGAWHYNHVTSTPIAKNFMLYCRLIYMLSILCVRHMIKVKVGIPESFKVGWYPPKKLGRVTLTGVWKTWKKYILQPPRQKKKIHAWQLRGKKIMSAWCSQEKNLTNQRQPNPTCSLANLSIYMQAMVFSSIKQGGVKN